MKNNFIILIFSILVLNNYANAQTNEKLNRCGTELSNAQKDWLNYYQRNDASFRQKSIAKIYVPVKLHIVGKDDGSGYMSIRDALNNICMLNQRFSKDSVQLYFFLYNDINYINNASFYSNGSKTNSIAMQLINSSKIANTINIYYVQSINGLCSYYNSVNDVIVISNQCTGIPTVSTHQVAHYFSIPHTFEGWENVYNGSQCDTNIATGMSKPLNPEKMDGSNCNIAGDGFCDTPPDYLACSWSCPYTCIYKDPNNTLIHPDSSLYMSFADDMCVNRFSNEEAQAIHANCSSIHSTFTLNAAQNFNAVTGTTTLITPSSADTPPADFVSCSWNAVAGATRYCVAIYKQGNGTNQVWSVMTSDTFAAFYANANLVENVLYNLKVMAYNPGKPCGTFSASVQFSPSAATGINSISSSVSSFKIYPNPVNNYFIVNYISETTVGNYSLIVYDIIGKQVYNKQIAANGKTEVVETSNWAAGEYFVQLRNADNKILKTEKVMVSK